MGFSTPVLDSPASGTAKRARAVRTAHPLRDTFRPTPAGDNRRGLRPGVAGVLKRSPLAYAAFILMGLILLGAIFAPLMSPYQKDKIDLTRQYRPSLDHPFGTDDLVETSSCA
jgi:ABC-type dipeptide/oligopeptide/nickel transport system permease subunit